MRKVFGAFLLAFMCACTGPDLKPTVQQLRGTLIECRKDYAAGKLRLAKEESLNKELSAARVKRLDYAIKAADEALKE